jgi:hypothetical protein
MSYVEKLLNKELDKLIFELKKYKDINWKRGILVTEEKIKQINKLKELKNG